MNSIFIQKENQQLGPFSLDQVREKLNSGTFLPNDYAWHEGLPDWVSIRELLANQRAANSTPNTANFRPKSPNMGLINAALICLFCSLAIPLFGLASIVCGIVLVAKNETLSGLIIIVTSIFATGIGFSISMLILTSLYR